MLYNRPNYNEEIITAQKYLDLTPEEKKKILKATPYVKPFETTDRDDPLFAGIRIIWKVPKYKFKL
jgi:hypothetical protein